LAFSKLEIFSVFDVLFKKKKKKKKKEEALKVCFFVFFNGQKDV
jgi:hypothetical protein